MAHATPRLAGVKWWEKPTWTSGRLHWSEISSLLDTNQHFLFTTEGPVVVPVFPACAAH